MTGLFLFFVVSGVSLVVLAWLTERAPYSPLDDASYLDERDRESRR